MTFPRPHYCPFQSINAFQLVLVFTSPPTLSLSVPLVPPPYSIKTPVFPTVSSDRTGIM